MPCAQYGKVFARSNAVSPTQGMMYALLPPAPSRLSDFDRSIRCCTAQLAAEHRTAPYSTLLLRCFTSPNFLFNSVSPRRTRWESTFCWRVDKYYWDARHGMHVLITTRKFFWGVFRPKQSNSWFENVFSCHLSQSNPESIFSVLTNLDCPTLKSLST